MLNPLNPQTTNKQADETLAAYLHGGRLPHALLIEGPEDSPKAEFAARVARGALCTAERSERPCGLCRDCVKAEKGIHPDILSYGGEDDANATHGTGGAAKKGARSFHIDTVREIRKQAYVQPNEAEAKVLILRDVQDMSVQAQNALLKIIEEPPRGVYFVLTCLNKASLLETILSRVAVIALSAEGGGAPREEEDTPDPAAEILCNLCIGSELEALAALTAYERDRPGLAALLGRMAQALSAAMLRPGGDQRLDNMITRIGRLRLLAILAIIEDMAGAVNQNAGGLLLVTTLSARIRAALADG